MKREGRPELIERARKLFGAETARRLEEVHEACRELYHHIEERVEQIDALLMNKPKKEDTSPSGGTNDG